MIFSRTEGFIDTEGFEKVVHKQRLFYYSGLFFMRGKKAGEESVLAFAEEYETTGNIPFIKMFGAFCLIICESDGKSIFFTDNSNLHCFFIGENYIGDNFLEIINCEKSSEFNMEALCEFFVLGGVYFGKTLVDGIHLTANDSYYIYSNGAMEQRDKGIGGIDGPSSIEDVSEFFRDIAYALSDQKVTLSLTGGYDSRMVFACIKDHVPTNVFISGNNEEDPDIVLAKKTARVAGQSLEVIKIEKPEISENYLRELFSYAQGCIPFVNDGFIQISTFIINRAKRGYDCYISGDGGVMHKDWWWIQDFPFYRRKHIDLNKFYDERIEYVNKFTPFGTKLLQPSKDLKNRFVNSISQYRRVLNTETYDFLYFNVNGPKIANHYSVYSKEIRSYAPLWEFEFVRYSYNLPRRKRFFYNSIREITTMNSRSIARVPTVYGTTASNEPLYIIRDIFFQCIDYSKKSIRMMGRKFLNKNLLTGNRRRWSGERDIRDLDISNRALIYCIDKGFIKQNTNLESLTYDTLGCMIQVYLLSNYMQK